MTDGTACVHKLERLHILHDGLVSQPTPVPVRRECPADAEPIRARLLLHHAPATRLPLLHVAQPAHEVRPEDARLNPHQPALRVELQDAV